MGNTHACIRNLRTCINYLRQLRGTKDRHPLSSQGPSELDRREGAGIGEREREGGATMLWAGPAWTHSHRGGVGLGTGGENSRQTPH